MSILCIKPFSGTRVISDDYEIMKKMHPKRVGALFFESEADNALTLNGERYLDIILQFLVPQ